MKSVGFDSLSTSSNSTFAYRYGVEAIEPYLLIFFSTRSDEMNNPLNLPHIGILMRSRFPACVTIQIEIGKTCGAEGTGQIKLFVSRNIL